MWFTKFLQFPTSKSRNKKLTSKKKSCSKKLLVVQRYTLIKESFFKFFMSLIIGKRISLALMTLKT